MKIESFEVEGYKNLTQPVQVDGLGDRDLVVVHGLNNVGKTNLLEAIQLPFLLIGKDEAGLPFREPRRLDFSRQEDRDIEPEEWFTVGAPTPITIKLRLRFEAAELKRLGVTQVYPCDRVGITLRVEKGVSGPEWQLAEYRFGDMDITRVSETNQKQVQKRDKFALYFARKVIWRQFTLIRLNRSLFGETSRRSRGHLSDELALALWDLKEAPEPERYQRWEAFAEACEAFADVLGDAKPVVSYDRHEGRATLYMQSSAGRVPSHLLGSGVQQLLAILGRMLVSVAEVIAVEEPEASLSFAIHARLRDAMRLIVGKGLGPSQILMTSHSPHFDTDKAFIAVASDDGVPVVGWRSPGEAAQFTGQMAEPPADGSAPVSYVTGDGLVRLPPFVRDSLGVPNGGGVVFHHGSKDGHIEMVSNATALAELGWGDEDAEEG